MDFYLDALSVLAAFIGCALALSSDLKQGIISNRLTGSMLALSFLFALGRLLSGDTAFITFYLANFIFGFLVGVFFWYIQAWSGGDAKLFWAVSSLLPVYPASFTGLMAMEPPAYVSYFFSLTLLFNLALLLLIRFFLAGSYLFFKEGKGREFSRIMLTPPLYLFSAMVFSMGLSNAANLSLLVYLSIPLIFILSLAENRSLALSVFFCILFSIAGLSLSGIYSLDSLAKNLAGQKSLLVFAFLLSAYAAGSKIPLTSGKKIESLKKGMSIAEEITIDEGIITRREVNPSLWNFISTLYAERKTKKDYLVRPSPAGLGTQDIETLKRHEKALGGYVKINRSFKLMPFIFMAFILSFFLDLFWIILK